MNDLNKLDLVNLVSGTSAISKDSLLLPLAKIEEDSLNVRTIFNDLEIQELSKSIKENGLKTPISVRANPDKPGFYIVNNGARRTKAFLLLEEEKIPAFIDENHDEIDQIIDNLHRVDLTPLEVAIKLDLLLKQDPELKKDKLAARLSKSNTWLSKHLALINMPEPVKFVYELGRVTSLDALYLLTSKWKKHSVELTKWLEQFHTKNDILSQITIQNFINTLENKTKSNHNKSIEPSLDSEIKSFEHVKNKIEPDSEVDLTGTSDMQNVVETYPQSTQGFIQDEYSSSEDIEVDFKLAPTESNRELQSDLQFISLSVIGDTEAKKMFDLDLANWIKSMQSQYDLKIEVMS